MRHAAHAKGASEPSHRRAQEVGERLRELAHRQVMLPSDARVPLLRILQRLRDGRVRVVRLRDEWEDIEYEWALVLDAFVL